MRWHIPAKRNPSAHKKRKPLLKGDRHTIKRFVKALPISIIVLAILIGIIALFSLIKLPSWPFIILLVICAECYHLSLEGCWIRCLGGGIALALGFMQVLLASLIPPGALGIAFLVLVVVFVNLDVMKVKVVANGVTMLFFNIVAQIPGIMTKENALPVFASYLLSVGIMAAILYPLAAATKKSSHGKNDVEEPSPSA